MAKSLRSFFFFLSNSFLLELSFFIGKKIFHDFERFALEIQACYLKAASAI